MLTYFLIQGISMATTWPGCFLWRWFVVSLCYCKNACSGQNFSIMVYTLCRVHGLCANREAFHCLQWCPPSIPTPSHPVGGYLGRPGHFVVLRMSTMQQGQGLSPPTTQGSEVPLLIFRPRVELSSHAEPESQPQGPPCGQSGRAACWHTAAFWRGAVSSQGSVIPCVHVKFNTGRQPSGKNNLPPPPLTFVTSSVSDQTPSLLWQPPRALLISASFLSAFSYLCGAWQFSLLIQLFKNDPNMQGTLTKTTTKSMFYPRKKLVPSSGWRKTAKF